MKKTLAFLLLVCISLFTLTGCGKGVSTKKPATLDEFEDFKEEKLEALEEMFKEEMVYSFKMITKTKINEGLVSGDQTEKLEGRVSIDMEDVEKSSLYIKRSISAKGTTYEEGSKTKISTKSEVETTLVNGTLYESYKLSSKYGESKAESTEKVKIDVEDLIDFNYINSLIDIGRVEQLFQGQQVYIDGDKCLLITSTINYHTEILLKFDGDELVSAEVTTKTCNSESKLEIKIGKIKSISKPKNESKYESID